MGSLQDGYQRQNVAALPLQTQQRWGGDWWVNIMTTRKLLLPIREFEEQGLTIRVRKEAGNERFVVSLL